MSAWIEELSRHAPPAALVEWARAQPTLEAAWLACPRGDWLLWLAGLRSPSETEQRHLVGKALHLAHRSRLPSGFLRLTLSEEQLAAEWAHPDAAEYR